MSIRLIPIYTPTRGFMVFDHYTDRRLTNTEPPVFADTFSSLNQCFVTYSDDLEEAKCQVRKVLKNIGIDALFL